MGKRGTPNTPTPLDHFIAIDFETLQYVADHGQITINFATDSQACNTMSRLRRLQKSLAAYKPDDPLSIAAKSFVFKWRVRTTYLTISDRLRSQETDAMRKALEGKCDVVSSDPMELTTPIDVDALEAEYQAEQARLKEQANGNEAGKG